MSEKQPLLSLREDRQHGTVLFPCAFYAADCRQSIPQIPFVVSHHWQEELEIVYFRRGTFQVEINMEMTAIDRECLCFINSGELHFISSDEDYLEQALVFSPAMLDFHTADDSQKKLLRPLIDGELSLPRFLFPGDAGFEEIVSEFHRIGAIFLKEYRQAETVPEGSPEDIPVLRTRDEQLTVSLLSSQLRIKAALLNIFASLQEQRLLQARSEHNRRIESLKTVMTYIRDHYQEKLYIRDLAGQIGMNEQYFCRFFKKALGRTPIEYINEFRIRRAVQLLQDTELAVMDVCLECGFNNLGHFMKEFRKYTSVTPLQLRKSYFKEDPLSCRKNGGTKK